MALHFLSNSLGLKTNNKNNLRSNQNILHLQNNAKISTFIQIISSHG